MSHDVIVVGGGAIGLAIARSLAVEHSVLLVERDQPGRQASWAAAGMLCPHSEAEKDDSMLRFGLDSLAMYPDFVRELEHETGIDVQYRRDGVLVLASANEEFAELRRRALWQSQAGLDARLLNADEVARLEPELTLRIQGALFYPGDHQIHPRRLLEALDTSCKRRGVDRADRSAVDEVLVSGGRVRGVRVGTAEIRGRAVVVAAGAWAGRITGLTPPTGIKPMKGQILSLQMPGPVFRHIVRWKNLYLVPRNDDRLVVGATDEDCGFDRSLTTAGIGGLLTGAQQMSRAVGSYPILETWTGLRPLIPGGLPVIGSAGVDGLFYALGHYRNGILLTPATAGMVRASVAGGRLPAYAEALSPMSLAESVSLGNS